MWGDGSGSAQGVCRTIPEEAMTGGHMEPRRFLPCFFVTAVLGIGHVVAFFGAASPRLFRIRPVSTCARTRWPCTNLAAATGGGDISNGSNPLPPPQPPLREEDEVLPPHFHTGATVAWVQRILDAFEENFPGEELMEPTRRKLLNPEEQARELAVADAAVISHDFLRSADDPIFIYGRRRIV